MANYRGRPAEKKGSSGSLLKMFFTLFHIISVCFNSKTGNKGFLFSITIACISANLCFFQVKLF